MKEIKKKYFDKIDERAKELSIMFSKGYPITEDIIKTIIELYSAAKIEQDYSEGNEFFEAAYHTPVTGDLEFFISRILYHYSQLTNSHWKISLRKQEGKTAPDIRISKENRTIGVVEIKAKAGWIQPVFSPERYSYFKEKFDKKLNSYNPDDAIIKFKEQIDKYRISFDLTPTDVFVFLPTLKLVHRKKSQLTLDDYQSYFEKKSGLDRINWLLLSENFNLDLANPKKNEVLLPTNNFELFIKSLSKK